MVSQVETRPAERPLADLVQEDARAARVFEIFGLQFCCNGRRTLRQAAEAQGAPLDAVLIALEDLGKPAARDVVPPEWEDLRVLVRHILDRHHAYVRSMIPAISVWLTRLVEHHGARHPELASVRATFRELAEHLTTHMMKEEHILFPYIADLEVACVRGSRLPANPFGTIVNPIGVMETDHVRAGELSTQLRDLTGGFAAPADACATYRLCYAELETFEQDLHRHVHLENNILFPRAIEIERSLM